MFAKFEKTRKYGPEFTRVCNATKLIHSVICHAFTAADETVVIGQLTKELMKVLRSDKMNQSGDRNFKDARLDLLIGFDFNSTMKLNNIFIENYIAVINKRSGNLHIDIPSFQPFRSIIAPGVYPHYRFYCIAAAFDFESLNCQCCQQKTGMLSFEKISPAISFDFRLTTYSGYHLFLFLALDLYSGSKGINGQNQNSSMAIVQIAGG